MVQYVIGSIPHSGPTELCLISASATKAIACSSIYEMVDIKDPWLLIENSSPCSGRSGFPFSLTEWFFTICQMPYNYK